MASLVKDPVYQQLGGLLRELIRSGEFGIGDKFPTEREVAARFQVSRATANKAISGLVAEGVLRYRQGIGTFVRHDLLDYDLRSLVSFTDQARAAGRRPETRVLDYRLVDAGALPAEAAEALELAAGETAWAIERLRLADGQPVILERRWLRAERCPGLVAEQLAGSLYALLTEHYGLQVAGADEVIRAVCLTAAEAQRLGVSVGAAALLVVAVGRLETDQPLWFERTLYRADAYEFRNSLGPIRPARPAAGVLRPEHETTAREN